MKLLLIITLLFITSCTIYPDVRGRRLGLTYSYIPDEYEVQNASFNEDTTVIYPFYGE